MGGYIFSHKIRLRPRLLKQFIPIKIIEEILLYDHKVICQDVLIAEMILTEMEIKTPARMTDKGNALW